jgi:hypothetical protein
LKFWSAEASSGSVKLYLSTKQAILANAVVTVLEKLRNSFRNHT